MMGVTLVKEDSASRSKLTEHTLELHIAVRFQYGSFKRRGFFMYLLCLSRISAD